MSDLKHTQRGFAYIEFQDRYDHKCSIQKSSLATEDAIWFGIDDANPQVLHGDARRLGIETDATSGWVPYPLPAEVSLATRMHLTQDQVRELLPTLIHFAETGDVLAPADCRTQPEATAPAQHVQIQGENKHINRTCTPNEHVSVAQDLSAAILGIKLPDPQCYEYGGREPTAYSAKQMRDLLKAAAALASSANALSAEIPEGCARGWNGTIYNGIAEIYHCMEEGEALHMVLDEKGVPRDDKDGCIYSLVGRVEQHVALSAGDRVDMNDWNTQMVAVQALLNCTSGELECVGERLLEGYIDDVKRVYAAILQSQKGGNNG